MTQTPNHLLRAFLWTLLALFLGCLALIAEAQDDPRPSLKAHGGSGGYSKAFRTP